MITEAGFKLLKKNIGTILCPKQYFDYKESLKVVMGYTKRHENNADLYCNTAKNELWIACGACDSMIMLIRADPPNTPVMLRGISQKTVDDIISNPDNWLFSYLGGCFYAIKKDEQLNPDCSN